MFVRLGVYSGRWERIYFCTTPELHQFPRWDHKVLLGLVQTKADYVGDHVGDQIADHGDDVVSVCVDDLIDDRVADRVDLVVFY